MGHKGQLGVIIEREKKYIRQREKTEWMGRNFSTDWVSDGMIHSWTTDFSHELPLYAQIVYDY